MKNKYPVYVISKGRFHPLTVFHLYKIGQPFRLVVEPGEYDKYADSGIDVTKILVTPENFSERGQGSIPVRNWVWDRAQELGYKRYWIMDDNIRGFQRLHENRRYNVETQSIFRAMEDFCDRYENVALAGPAYRQFHGGARESNPPFLLNHRIYSCLLIQADLPFRWRGKYNEDTDLSLRVLKAGLVTVKFLWVRQNKRTTLTIKGGNEEIYKETDLREEFVDSLVAQHPEHVRKVFRYGRYHHEVNFSDFKQNLIRRPGIEIPEGVDNYGMVLHGPKEK